MFHRVVHLDLKGAPWRVTYLEKLLPLLKKWGATGILLEWEDTFPYSGDLIVIGSHGPTNRENLYIPQEVAYILQFIKDLGMEPIQLFQTIGHMEFVLKHKQFSHLRELPRSSSVLCPSQEQSVMLCKEMVRQLLQAQPGANFIHIGGDEAWHMNVCAKCQHKSNCNDHKVASLYLDHITAIARYIKDNYNVHVLMWDDMMRSINVDTLKAYNIGNLVQPVVWNYNAPSLHIDKTMWDRYSTIFHSVWAGSAFKGANGSCQMVCDVSRYASNQAAWQQEINNYKHKINFVGVILTGWSRYDHYATLCELLPVSLPSVSSCLNMWTQQVTEISSCLPQVEWCGHELASVVLTFDTLREHCVVLLNGDQIETWMNEWQIKNQHTSIIQVENLAANAKQYLEQLSKYSDLRALVLEYTGAGSADEMMNKVSVLHARLSRIHNVAMRILETTCAVVLNVGANWGAPFKTLLYSDYITCDHNKTLNYGVSEIQIYFYDFKNNFNISYPIDTAAEAITSNYNLDISRKLIFFVPGYKSHINKKTEELVRQTFKDVPNTYLIIVDHSIYTSARGGKIKSYERSVTHVYYIAQALGHFLAKLRADGFPTKNIHAIGHSLGSQMLGYVGTKYTELTQEKLPRVTGIDPAGPCFSNTFVDNQIRKGVGEYVEVYHCNAGGLGTTSTLADIDFFFNKRLLMPISNLLAMKV